MVRPPDDARSVLEEVPDGMVVSVTQSQRERHGREPALPGAAARRVVVKRRAATTSRPRVGIFDHTGRWLGGGQLVVAHMAAALAPHYDVDLVYPRIGYTLEQLAAVFHVDLSGVRERILKPFPVTFNVPAARSIGGIRVASSRSLSRPYDLFIYAGHGVPPICHARRGLVYSHFPMEWSPEARFRPDARWRPLRFLDRGVRGWAYRLFWRRRIGSYRKILANSLFTARWVERRWRAPAEVLYPPVELELGEAAGARRDLIVSVGRFSGRGRSKNQLEQIAAFRRFLAARSGDWRLRIIGFSGRSVEDRAYLDAVQEAARPLPVEVLADGDRQVICRSLREAKLFWHTAGISIDEEESPQALEHFGIATVEAMQAGCIPVVIDSGGQREIVDTGVNGFLCRNLDDLVARSIDLVREENGSRLSAMRAQAEKKAEAFGKKRFHEKIRVVAAQCLA